MNPIPRGETKKKILVVSSTYPLERIGGAEYTAFLLANAWAQHGYDLTFLTTESEAEETFQAGDLKVIKIQSRRAVGAAPHRLRIETIIRSCAPDVCVVFAFPENLWVAPICKRIHIPVVTLSQARWEALPLSLTGSLREITAYIATQEIYWNWRSFFAIRHSRVHICISHTLESLVRSWLPKAPTRVIYLGQPVPPAEKMHTASTGQIVWVNNVKHYKHPEAFIELARRLPQYQFVQVAGIPESRYGRQYRTLLQNAPKNFQFLGTLPVEGVREVIAASDLYILTSDNREGFGLSLIKSWLLGVPTVTFYFDPDGIINKEGLGRACHSFEELVETVDRLMRDEPTRREIGQRARAYALKGLTLEHMIAAFEKVIAETLAEPEGTAA